MFESYCCSGFLSNRVPHTNANHSLFPLPIIENGSTECSCDAGGALECEPESLICPAVLCPSQLLDSCPLVNPLEDPDMFTDKFCNSDFDGCMYGEARCCPEDDPVPNVSKCSNRTSLRVSFRIVSSTQILTTRCSLHLTNKMVRQNAAVRLVNPLTAKKSF